MAELRALDGLNADERQLLKEAVCDAVLERTRGVVSGEGPHGGIVGENHVILLVPTRTDAPPPEELARALNEQAASEELDRICGSASISVRLLESMRLRKPPT